MSLWAVRETVRCWGSSDAPRSQYGDALPQHVLLPGRAAMICCCASRRIQSEAGRKGKPQEEDGEEGCSGASGHVSAGMGAPQGHHGETVSQSAAWFTVSWVLLTCMSPATIGFFYELGPPYTYFGDPVSALA